MQIQTATTKITKITMFYTNFVIGIFIGKEQKNPNQNIPLI
jgi:hypothetical protein